MCKRTVKDKKAKPEVEVVQLYEDSVQVCTLYSTNKTVCKYSIAYNSKSRNYFILREMNKDNLFFFLNELHNTFRNNVFLGAVAKN